MKEFQNMSLRNLLMLSLSSFVFFFSSCKKDNTEIPVKAKVEWMKVLDESVSGNMKDDALLGQNGRVLTDANDNIYVYYYSSQPRSAIVLKCDPNGSVLWRKVIDDCIPMDMALKPDGHLALAVRDFPGNENVLTIFDFAEDGTMNHYRIVHVNIGGSFGVINATMYAMQDNSILISGVYLSQFFVGGAVTHEGYFLRLDANYVKIYNFITLFLNFGTTKSFEQTSMVPVSNDQFLCQLSYKGDEVQSDSLTYGYTTVLTNPDTAEADTTIFYNTGFLKQSNGNYGGFYNRYADRMIKDGGYNIHHYSAPVSVSPGGSFNSPVTNGFIRIGNDADIKDTIAFDLPEGYRVLSCNKGANGFLMTAYKARAFDVPGDYSAYQTLFCVGDNNWQITSRFSFQEFYSDVFPSCAPTSDNGYIIMGKVQSFNGPAYKLVLMKWKGE